MRYSASAIPLNTTAHTLEISGSQEIDTNMPAICLMVNCKAFVRLEDVNTNHSYRPKLVRGISIDTLYGIFLLRSMLLLLLAFPLCTAVLEIA